MSHNYFESITGNLLTEMELANCLRGLPALLFRVEIKKNRIEYINNYKVETLGDNTFLILKNKDYSKQFILPEDYPHYENFIKSVKQKERSSAIFRIKDNRGGIHWLKLFGAPNEYDSKFYLGMLVDISANIGMIEKMQEEQAENDALIEMLDNPVLLIDQKTLTVVSHNKAAQELFGYRFDEFHKLKFSNLYPPDFKSKMLQVYEDIVFDKKWLGPIQFKRKNNNSRFIANTSIRSLKIKEKRVLRVAINSVESTELIITGNERSNEEFINRKNAHLKKLMLLVENDSNIQSILNKLLENPFMGLKTDGIIYSDILIKKGLVYVYGAGKVFDTLPFGDSFSYEGTIAENIEQYKLTHLIVEDTMDSIKAIDWALFIPYGVRSYFARPFYERNTLRSVLILCSTEPNTFTEEKIGEYEIMDKPFIKGLKNWRKASRSKKTNLK